MSWRRYRTARGYYYLWPAVSRSPGGWHAMLGPWVWTTEVESG